MSSIAARPITSDETLKDRKGLRWVIQQGQAGRKPKIDPEEVRRLHSEEKLSPSAIAKRLKIARSSVYRFLPEAN